MLAGEVPAAAGLHAQDVRRAQAEAERAAAVGRRHRRHRPGAAGLCSARPASCCSSRARMWPTCRSCAPRAGTRSSRSAPRSAPAAWQIARDAAGRERHPGARGRGRSASAACRGQRWRCSCWLGPDQPAAPAGDRDQRRRAAVHAGDRARGGAAVRRHTRAPVRGAERRRAEGRRAIRQRGPDAPPHAQRAGCRRDRTGARAAGRVGADGPQLPGAPLGGPGFQGPRAGTDLPRRGARGCGRRPGSNRAHAPADCRSRRARAGRDIGGRDLVADDGRVRQQRPGVRRRCDTGECGRCRRSGGTSG